MRDRRSRLAAIALLAASSGAAGWTPVVAQTQILDRGVLLVMRDGDVVGREEFAVRRGTSSATMAGFTLASTAFYPATRPEHTLVSVVEIGPDSFPQSSRFERGNGETFRVATGIGPRRIAVRRVTASGESAREYPARDRALIVDDSVFVVFAVRPPIGGAARRLTMPGELGNAVTVTDLGVGPTTVRGRSVELQHIRLEGAAGGISAWYDAEGRLMKIAWPGRRLTVVREESP